MMLDRPRLLRVLGWRAQGHDPLQNSAVFPEIKQVISVLVYYFFPQVPACFPCIFFIFCTVLSDHTWKLLFYSPFFQQYFNKRKTYFAHDALQQCTVGDIVLLKALPVPRTKHVKHELAEIIFKVGRVIDPVTGKPCAGTTYLESPVSLETTCLPKNLEELKSSSAQ